MNKPLYLVRTLRVKIPGQGPARTEQDLVGETKDLAAGDCTRL